ncbi:MAG: hypothetical protein V9H69_10695 [Anaerolineae bacterium]
MPAAVQTGLGNSTYGFGHAVSSGFRVADDFTVPAGGWNVASITFFAYQTGSTTASTINAVNVRIWDGPPNAGGTVIWGDTTTNRLASSAWSNIYRVLDSALTNSQRPIMADVATVGTFLPAGDLLGRLADRWNAGFRAMGAPGDHSGTGRQARSERLAVRSDGSRVESVGQHGRCGAARPSPLSSRERRAAAIRIHARRWPIFRG